MNTFTPLKIGSVELPNRLMMAPVKTGFGTPDGKSTYRHEAYYRRRAEGGVGAIIVEPCYIDQLGKEHPRQLGISEYDHLEGLRRLVSAIHDGGGLAVAHLNHAGRAAKPKVTGAAPEAPSEVTCPMTGATPVAMTEERIKQIALEFGGAARRAAEAGFDAIELQFGLGYLVAQFLSTHTNLRKDLYGGNRENRYRFASEILVEVGRQNHNKLPVIARISASEQVTDGLEIGDSIRLVRFLEEHGVTAVHVASGSICDTAPWYFQHMRLPNGKNLEWAGLIKKETTLPVIVAGRMGDPAVIRRALNEELVDAVALGRPLVADPDLPVKMIRHRDEDVMQCGGCLQGCFARVRSGEGLGCIVNPRAGYEADQIPASEKPKTVVVIGGGPGGMQAALSAHQRGHRVVLFEKGHLGGQANLSWLPPGKAMMKRPLDSLKHLVEDSNLDLRTSHSATVSDILAEHPDVTIVATGATPVVPSIPGLDHPLTGEEVLLKKARAGRRVLIIGGGMVGLETAEFLLNEKRQITVVELLEDVARDMVPITRKLTLQNLKKGGIEILTRSEVTRLEGKKVYVTTEGTEQLLGEFDSVVVAIGTRSVNELEVLLKKEGLEVRVIGDAREPRQIYDAVKEGHDVAVGI